MSQLYHPLATIPYAPFDIIFRTLISGRQTQKVMGSPFIEDSVFLASHEGIPPIRNHLHHKYRELYSPDIQKDLTMEKHDVILFVGYGPETPDAIRYAKAAGATTILTDHVPLEQNPLKSVTDEYWDIDINDVDALAEKAKERDVTAFYAGSNEPCLDSVQELCKRFGFPFYASEEGWKGTRNKEYFKQIAIQAGLRVPRTFNVDSRLLPEHLEAIQYPVIIKPVDACASRGIAICKNQDDLIQNFPNALKHSQAKRVLVEQYIDGEFVELFLIVHGGKAELHFCPIMSMLVKDASDDSYRMSPIGNLNTHGTGWKPIIITTFVSNLKTVEAMYEGALEEKINSLVSSFHMKEGVVALQAMADSKGELYFFEMGYRLDGDLLWKVASLGGDANQAQISVDHALGRTTPEDEFNKRLPENIECGGFGLWLRPGTIADIQGVDELNAIPGVTMLASLYHAGDTMHEGTRTLADIAFLVSVNASDENSFIAKTRQAMSSLHVIDTNGNEMLYPLD